MVTIITINSQDFTIETMRAEWAEDAELSAAEVTEFANEEYAWLVLHTGETLRGWTYTGDGFTGPARTDAVEMVLQLMSDATDAVLAMADEIKADVAAEAQA